MDEATAKAITRTVLSDNTRLPVHIKCISALQIVSALLLARRHPNISKYTKDELKLISRSFSKAVLALHPNAQAIIPAINMKLPSAELTQQVMGDETLIPVYITIRQAWLLVCGIQLTVRHPGFPVDLRDAVTGIALQFEGSVAEMHPDAKTLLDMGWDPAYDV